MTRTVWQVIFIFFFSFSFSSICFASRPYVNLTAGGGIYNQVDRHQTLTLFNSPAPGITNTYVADHDNLHGFLAGVGVGYQINLYRCLRLDLEVQGSYIHYGTITGTVHPLVNVAPNFDTLEFSYDAKSYLFMIQPSLVLETELLWNPYISVGFGKSWNKLSDYDEFPLTGSTAAPTLYPFRPQTKSSLAYSFGIGFENKLSCHVNAQIGYQYLHAGHATLNPELGQETDESLSIEHLNAHFLVVNLLIA